MTLSDTIASSIWTRSGIDPNGPKAFYSLSLSIYEKTGESLGENTLKRLLGYLKDDREPHTHTLDIIARYLDSSSWEQLTSASSPGESGFSHRKGVLSITISVGQLIQVTYAPDRIIEMKYLGDSKYLVTRSINSSLQEGDTLEIGGIYPHFPLIASNVMRNGQSLGTYCAAEHTGISSITLL